MATLDPQAHIAMLERELQWAHLKIQVLEERLRQRRIQVLGPQSETLSDLQLEFWLRKSPAPRAKKWRRKRGANPFHKSPRANADRIRAAARYRRTCRVSSRWFGV